MMNRTCATALLGNVLVIAVILLHRKMRSVVNFCLANLAVADLCVGVFCVLPNLSLYMSQPWHLGMVGFSLRILFMTRMWANAQRDGRPAKYRWRPLFNAAKFG